MMGTQDWKAGTGSHKGVGTVEPKQDVICPFCGKDMPPESRYCLFCGKELAGQSDQKKL